MDHLRLRIWHYTVFSLLFVISCRTHQTNTIELKEILHWIFSFVQCYLDHAFCSTTVFNIVFNTNPLNGGKLITVIGLFYYRPFVNNILYFMCLRQNEKLHLFVGGYCCSLNKNFLPPFSYPIGKVISSCFEYYAL